MAKLPTPPPITTLTILVEELVSATKGETVVLKGTIQEWEHAGALLTVPAEFAAPLRLGDVLKVTRA